MGRALSALYDSLDFVRPEQIVEALDESISMASSAIPMSWWSG
jgi:hypothetical protein